MKRCVESIADGLRLRERDRPYTLIIRSTVPVGATERLLALVAERADRILGVTLLGGMCPEFLREGVGLKDFLEPEIMVLGADDPASQQYMRDLFSSIPAAVVEMSTREAEMVKYVNNAFHALKVAFANEIGRVADVHGVDGTRIMETLCMDRKLNISAKYLRPGFAFGGACLPKDLRALRKMATDYGVKAALLHAISDSNDEQIRTALSTVLSYSPERVALIGMTFKPGTDDLRESPALALARLLIDSNVRLRMWDRNVDPKSLLGANRQSIEDLIPDWKAHMASSPAEAIVDADVIVVTHSDHYDVALQNDLGRATPVVELQGLCRGLRTGGTMSGPNSLPNEICSSAAKNY